MAKLKDKFYNRTIEGALELDSETDSIPNILVEDAILEVPSGTPVSVIGINSDDELVKGSVSGGTQLYKHQCSFGTRVGGYDFDFTFYSYRNYRFSNMNEDNKTDFESVKPLLSRDIVGLVSYGGAQYVGIISGISVVQTGPDSWGGAITVQDITNNQERTVFITDDTVAPL